MGMIEGINGDGNLIRRPTVSTKLDPWVVPETKQPTKGHVSWAGLRPSITYVAEVCFFWLQWERMILIF